MLQSANEAFKSPEHKGKAACVYGEVHNPMPMKDWLIGELLNILHIAVVRFPLVHFDLLSLNMRVDPEAVNGH